MPSSSLRRIVIVACLSQSAAYAETDSVRIYGVLDAGVAYQSRGLTPSPSFAQSFNPFDHYQRSNPNVGRVVGVASGPLQSPRLGIVGAEDLGGGWRAGFNLETGFDLTSGTLNNSVAAIAANSGLGSSYRSTFSGGSMAGQLFNRAAWVSLGQAELGELRIGRNATFASDLIPKIDPLQGGVLFSPLGFSSSLGGGIGVSDNVRQDSSLKYLNKTGAVEYGLMYEFGNGTGVATQGRGGGAMVGYALGGVKLRAVYQFAQDALKTGVAANANDANRVAVAAYNTTGFLVALEYAATDRLNLKAGLESYTLSSASDRMTTADIPALYGYAVVSPYDASASASSVPIGTASGLLSYSGPRQTTRVGYLGGDYQWSSRLRMYFGGYLMLPQAYAGYGGATWKSVSSAVNTWTSLLFDYTLGRRQDVYLGISHQTWSGTADAYSQSPNKGGFPSDTLVAAGFRHRF